MKLGWIASAAAAMGLSAGAAFAESETLKTVQERGTLLCSGHNGSYFGFVEVNDKNEWKGLDIDLCRAMTTALLGDPEKAQMPKTGHPTPCASDCFCGFSLAKFTSNCGRYCPLGIAIQTGSLAPEVR